MGLSVSIHIHFPPTWLFHGISIKLGAHGLCMWGSWKHTPTLSHLSSGVYGSSGDSVRDCTRTCDWEGRRVFMSDVWRCSTYSWLCGTFEWKTCIPVMFMTGSFGPQVMFVDLFLFEDLLALWIKRACLCVSTWTSCNNHGGSFLWFFCGCVWLYLVCVFIKQHSLRHARQVRLTGG